MSRLAEPPPPKFGFDFSCQCDRVAPTLILQLWSILTASFMVDIQALWKNNHPYHISPRRCSPPPWLQHLDNLTEIPKFKIIGWVAPYKLGCGSLCITHYEEKTTHPRTELMWLSRDAFDAVLNSTLYRQPIWLRKVATPSVGFDNLLMSSQERVHLSKKWVMSQARVFGFQVASDTWTGEEFHIMATSSESLLAVVARKVARIVQNHAFRDKQHLSHISCRFDGNQGVDAGYERLGKPPWMSMEMEDCLKQWTWLIQQP
jgi:hypothetical protein